MKKNLFRVFIGLGVTGAVLAVFLALQEGTGRQKDVRELKKLRRTYAEAPDETEEDGGSPDLLDAGIDFDSLKKINGDIVGWIYIPGTEINYPIMQHNSDNFYYLHHSFRKEENALGSIYIYHEFSSDFTDPHTILFGHNMASGQMFGGLSDYTQKSFWEEFPTVYLYLPDRSVRCTIYSAYSCSVNDDTYRYNFVYGSRAYRDFQRHTKQMALWDSGIIPSPEEAVISLSTCTDERDASRRFVVNCTVRETRNNTDRKHTDSQEEKEEKHVER